MCLQALQLCAIISCAHAPEGFPGQQFLSLLQGLMVLSPVPAIPSQNYRAELMLVSFLPPRVPRTKARVGGRCSLSSGLMVSDDSTGWKMASHRRSRSTSSECAGRSPPLGMSPQRCASFLPSLPYMEVFTFLVKVASCLYSCPFRVPGVPRCPLPQQLLSPHVSPASSGLLPLGLPLRLYSGGITSSKPKGPIKRYFPHPKKEIVP